MTEEQVFLAALDLPDATSRAAFLDEQCAGDAGLRGNVEALLASHFKSGDFMDVPAPVQIDVEPPFDHAVTIQSDVMPAERFPEPVSDDVKFLDPTSRPDSLGRIGHYEVLQVLGVGGFGIVLRAFDDVLERVVAVKVMAPQLATTSPARKRFLREARSSAQVRHENVVQVYEVGEQPLPHLVMEFIPGETLQQRLDRIGPLDVHEVLRIGRQIAEGLAAAHAMDLIHRDIKPGNVLLEGGQLKVKITDFGLARAADDASMTQSGQIVGTPMYMAPEQVWGHALDQRADLFSLGTVMYQMVSGRTPFRAESSVAVLKRVAEDTPRNIREVIPETPQWLCDIITKLHAKQPDDRYQSARDVADVLADCEEQLKVNSKLQDYSRIPRAKPAAGRRRWKWVAAAALLLPLIALAATEVAGVTHLFRERQTAVAPIQPESRSTPVVAPTADPQVLRVAALPAADQVEEVRKELVRLNPGFDGQVEHRIEGDVVVEFRVVTDQVTDISPVRALTGLRSLSCSGSFVGLGKLGASALLPLKGLPLTHLDCRDSPAVSDLSALAEMKLTSLDCRATSVGDADVKHLTGMKDLQWLSLWGTQVTDASLKVLGGFKNLQHLSLQGTMVTSAGLMELVGLDKLAYLDLYAAVQVTDAGLAHLASLKGLKYLELRGPRVTDEGVDRLAAALPGLRISTWNRTIEPKVGMAPFTDADAKRIAALPPAEQVAEVSKELMRLNPAFDGTLTPTIDRGVVTGLKVLTDEVTNIAPLRALTGLTSLDLRGTYLDKGKLSDLSPLKGLALTWLDCSSTQISDLTPLAGMPLEFLQVNHNPVSDLVPLVGMPLVNLGIAQTKVTDLSPLKGLKLKTLGAQLLPITDLSPLAGMPLTGLDLYHTVGVTSLEPLRGLPLEGINLHDVPVSDLSPLAGMTTLRNLQLEGSSISDLTPLAGLKLTDLLLRNKQISDLSPLAGMPLIRLHIFGTSVSDLTPLQGMPLQEFRMSPQNITQGLDILRDIKSLKTIGIAGNQAWPVAEFWERFDKGEFGTTRTSSVHDTWLKEWLQLVPTLTAEQQVAAVVAKLKERNPGLDGTAKHRIEGSVVTGLTFTPVTGQDAVRDLSPVRALAGLTSLNLWGCSGLGDLEPLKGLPLTRLLVGSLDVSIQVRDLEPLRGMKLTELQLYRCQVQNLEPLQDMPLTRLTLFSRQVGDLGPLKGLPLTTLGLAYCTQIQDFTPLAGLPLISLHLNDCRVRDLEPFKGMKLTELHLTGTPVRDLELVKGMPLKKLSIFQKPGVTDLRPLQGMELEEIYLTPKNITQGLEILRDMQSLKTIGVAYNQAWPPAEFWERYDKGEFK